MNKYTIVMGEYPQNCGLEKEPIEWIVLNEEEHRCLCINKYLIDCKQYHNLSEKVIWQDCMLRYYGEENAETEGKYDFISCVNFDGYIEYGADDVAAMTSCIRPAFWLKRI